MKKGSVFLVVLWGAFLMVGGVAAALDLGEKLSIEGDLAAAYQYQSLSNAPGFENTGRGALVFQPVVRFQLTDNDEIKAKFGFGAGNALNDGTGPFVLAPWGADLEQDVKGINGRDRDYLLTAWYARSVGLGNFGNLIIKGGLIDATDYLDGNAYANDEFTQFMNEALINNPIGFLPSYDLGGVLQWDMGGLSAKAIVMDVGGDEDDPGHHFYGAELGYRLDLGMGAGSYRLAVTGTSKAFEGPAGQSDRSKTGILFSADQELGDTLGVWLRFGRQDNDALILHRNLYSAGLDIKGTLWNRGQDNIGVGFALLDGGNDELDKTQIAEIYYRWAFNEFAALSLHFQYQEDQYDNGDKPKGLVSGVRFAAAF
jgi:hypothetical protein